MLEDLQVLLKKEISAMREVLANMHQEELSLMLGDQNTLRLVLDERSKLLAQLSDLRLARIEISKKIKTEGDLTLHCEILSLRDQILALVERMNFQNLRNVFLLNQGDPAVRTPQHSLQPAAAPQEKRAPCDLPQKRIICVNGPHGLPHLWRLPPLP